MNRELAHVIISGAVLALFTIAFFITTAYRLPWLIIPLVIAALIITVMDKKRGLALNIALLLISPLLFVFIVEYFAALAGMLLALIAFLRVALPYYKAKRSQA